MVNCGRRPQEVSGATSATRSLHTVDAALVWERLAAVADPELPALSILDLGMIRAVGVADCAIVVELMPTFLGCPALDLIRDAIAEQLALLGEVTVRIVRDEAWTTDRITAAGRDKLRAAGFASPQPVPLDLREWPAAPCPHCGSVQTRLDSPFGPTPCRAIHYCRSCRQPFEQFKAI